MRDLPPRGVLTNGDGNLEKEIAKRCRLDDGIVVIDGAASFDATSIRRRLPPRALLGRMLNSLNFDPPEDHGLADER